MMIDCLEYRIPFELEVFLDKVSQGNDLTTRIDAIKDLSSLMETHPLKNHSTICAAVNDLLDAHHPSFIRQPVFSFLASCVRQADLNSADRNLFFNTIASHVDDQSFSNIVELLVLLTKSGKNVQSVDTILGPFLITLLKKSIHSACVTRNSRRKDKATPNQGVSNKSKEEHYIRPILAYINDVIKFNSKVFTDENITSLLAELLAICKLTISEVIMQKATMTVENLVTYAYIPKNMLASCLEVLCDVYRQLRRLRETTWAALNKIFGSHFGQFAVSKLLDTLRYANEDTSISVLRGESYVLQQLTMINGLNGLPTVPFKLLLPSLANCAIIGHEKVDADILQFLIMILQDAKFAQKLLDEDDWASISLIVVRCAERCGFASSGKDIIPGGATSENTPMNLNDDPAVNRSRIGMICELVNYLATKVILTGESSLMLMLLKFGSALSDNNIEALLSYFKKEKLLSPSNKSWKEYFGKLHWGIYLDQRRSIATRASVLSLLTQTFFLFDSFAEADNMLLARLLIDCIVTETDELILGILATFATEIMLYNSESLFRYTLYRLQKAIYHANEDHLLRQSNYNHKGDASNPAVYDGSTLLILVKCVIRTFIKLLNVDPSRTIQIFQLLMDIATSGIYEIKCRLLTLKVLFCLRCTPEGAMYLVCSSGTDSLAALLNRRAHEGRFPGSEEQLRYSRNSTDVVRQERSLIAESVSSSRASLSQASSRSSDSLAASQRDSKPLWLHPGPPGLPERPSTVPSPVTHKCQRLQTNASGEDLYGLDMTIWLNSVISLLESEKDWEAYAYIIVHLGPQLTNKSLFIGSVDAVKRLRTLICDTVNTSAFLEPHFPSKVRRSDIASCFYYILTILTGYHEIFRKEELDDIVKAFLFGIGAGDYASRYSIHALAVCCYEIPLPLSKLLEPILQKMSQIITQTQVAVDILEFLASLARLDHVYKNFREEEFRTVFGISFRYLQFVRDQKQGANITSLNRRSRDALRHSGGSRELRSRLSQDLAHRETPSSDDLPQYVYSLAYHVITFWFMALRLKDRPKYMAWVKKNLSYVNEFGKEVLEEQAVVTVDMMYRVAFSDRDETNPNPFYAKASDGDRSKRTWVTGTSLITIETSGRTGLSHITRRRPSSTRHSIYQPNLTDPPNHQAPITTGLAAEAFYKSSYVGVWPEDIFQEFYSSLELCNSGSESSQMAILLPTDETVDRAIGSLDRVSTLDSHKVGVIYISRQQTNEAEILSNTLGSPDYNQFLEGLGKLTRLKDASFNTQGLDRQSDADGEFTICWRDRVTELVFHITSMMPTNLKDDPRCTNKKKHIGNDFVNIVYNSSGFPFSFDTFPSDFNYVYIVVSPEGLFSDVAAQTCDDDTTSNFYKVNILTKPGFPRITFAAETKLISGPALPTFVRLLALNASVFCHIWANRDGGEHVSSWRTRLRQINTLRRRYSDRSEFLDSPRQTTPSSTSSTEPRTFALHSIAAATAARENVSAFRRASATTIPGELGGSRSIRPDAIIEGERGRPNTSRS